MTGLRTRHDRTHFVNRLYTRVTDGPVPREISFDDQGVVALAGSQMTNQVWYAERIEHDSDAGTMTFRVLRLDPTKKKGVHLSKRTGMPEFGSRLLHCQYGIADVTVHELGPSMNLGHALRPIQEEYNTVHRHHSLDQGVVNSDGQVISLYRRWFVARPE